VSAGLEILTFGCRLNAYESEIVEAKAREAGLDRLPGGAVVVNTCAVTAEAVRQARQAIRKARREHPQARIVVTGCAAQTEGAAFAAMAEVDLVIGNEDKLGAQAFRALPDFGVNSSEKLRVNDIMTVRRNAPQMIEGMEGRTRAFLHIQNGCDHRCTFCIIPFGRGPSRSVPAGEVVAQARRLVENGYREVVLTGVDAASWGGDLPGRPKLGRLVASLLRETPQLERLRLSSIDPAAVDEELLGVIADEARFMPHLHLSLQHGDDLILKRMKRRHDRRQAVDLCERLRRLRPEIAIGADLIAGFPTETEAMAARNEQLIADCGIAHTHVFPFSPRKGTPAARMPQLGPAIVRERAARLRAAAAAGHGRHLSAMRGRQVEVLMERDGFGRSGQYTPVEVDAPANTIVRVRIAGARAANLTGEPLAAPSAAA
jgi:threonylcarbamoyladenosine tRNA methylthiotransferase MtaB